MGKRSELKSKILKKGKGRVETQVRRLQKPKISWKSVKTTVIYSIQMQFYFMDISLTNGLIGGQTTTWAKCYSEEATGNLKGIVLPVSSCLGLLGSWCLSQLSEVAFNLYWSPTSN